MTCVFPSYDFILSQTNVQNFIRDYRNNSADG